MLLNYFSSTGFCINKAISFNIGDGRLVGVVDTQNLRDRVQISGNPSHDFECMGEYPMAVKPSRYLLQTEENFGCILHTKTK